MERARATDSDFFAFAFFEAIGRDAESRVRLIVRAGYERYGDWIN